MPQKFLKSQKKAKLIQCFFSSIRALPTLPQDQAVVRRLPTSRHAIAPGFGSRSAPSRDRALSLSVRAVRVERAQFSLRASSVRLLGLKRFPFCFLFGAASVVVNQIDCYRSAGIG